MSHTYKRWSPEILRSIQSKLKESSKIEKKGCWLYGTNSERVPQIRIRPVALHKLSIRYISLFLYKEYDLDDLDQKSNIISTCGKKNCWNPEHLQIKP